MDADEYVIDVLGQLEADLARTLTVVRNGIERLEVERQYQIQGEQEPVDNAMLDA